MMTTPPLPCPHSEESPMIDSAGAPKLQGSVTPLFTGALRWLAAIVLVVGPLLQAVAFVLAAGVDENAACVACWAAHPARSGLSMASGLLALPFLMGATAVLVALTQAYSRRLAWLGGVCMTFAVVGLGAVHGYELA